MQTKSLVQRQVEEEEEEEELLQTKPLVQRRVTGDAGSSTAPPIVHEVLRSPGRPLDPATRRFMEPRFGHDFSQVGVHTDAKAAESARAVNAEAYTVGQHIVFGVGQYAPGTGRGQALLAHELVHVMQQEGIAVTFPARLQIEGPDTVSESEAVPVTEAVASGTDFQLSGAVPTGYTLQRACGPAAIGRVRDCIGMGGQDITDVGFSSADLFLFRVGCDELRSGEEARLRDRTRFILPTDTVAIHGFASEEGDAAFNDDLSCARAHVAEGILHQEGVTSPMTLYNHGATPGVREDRRSVVLAIARAGSRQRQETGAGGTAPAAGTPPTRVCGGVDEFFRTILLIDPNIVSDAVTCLCFGAGIADILPIPGVGSNPVVEGVDCACNILTTLQEIYNRGADGGCWDIANLSTTDISLITALAELTIIDCGSLPIGTALGELIGGLVGGGGGGAAAGPPGAVGGGAAGAGVGAIVGDFIVDVAAMALQNLITQGTPLPVAQYRACERLVRRARATWP